MQIMLLLSSKWHCLAWQWLAKTCIVKKKKRIREVIITDVLKKELIQLYILLMKRGVGWGIHRLIICD